MEGLSIVAWALATANVEAEETFDAIARELEPRVHSANPQNLSNTLWALAKSGRSGQTDADRALFRSVAEHAVRTDLNGWNVQNVANTLWAFAKVATPPGARSYEADLFECCARYVLNGIAESGASGVRQFGPHSLSILA